MMKNDYSLVMKPKSW